MVSEEKLAQIIAVELEKRSKIDCSRHSEHHEFIEMLIAEQRMKQERWEQIKRQVLGWGLIALAGWLGKVIADGLGIEL